MRLDKMETTLEDGDLNSPATVAVLDTISSIFKLDLHGAFLTANSQEFIKLSKDFLKDAKKFFGARVTQGEINLFLKTIPNLLQSDEGKLRLIRNMRNFNESKKIKHKAMRDIIKENNGYSPRNLKSLVEKRTEKDTQRLAKEFKKQIKDDARYSRILTKIQKREGEQSKGLFEMLSKGSGKEPSQSLENIDTNLNDIVSSKANRFF